MLDWEPSLFWLNQMSNNQLVCTKKRNTKVGKKPTIFKKVDYFISIFQGISLGVKQFVFAVWKDWLNRYNTHDLRKLI